MANGRGGTTTATFGSGRTQDPEPATGPRTQARNITQDRTSALGHVLGSTPVFGDALRETVSPYKQPYRSQQQQQPTDVAAPGGIGFGGTSPLSMQMAQAGGFGGLTPQYQPGGRVRIPGMDVEQQQGRLAQQQLGNILYQQALGGGPSAAQPLLQGAMEESMRQQMQMAAGAGPSGRAAAIRGAQLAQPEMGARFGREAAALRAQEQQAAQGLLQQQLSGMRGQDLQAQLGAAGLLDTGAQRDLAALGQAAGIGMGLGDQELQRAGLGLQADIARQEGGLQGAQLQQQRDVAINQMLNDIVMANLGLQAEQSKAQSGLISGLLGGLGIPGL